MSSSALTYKTIKDLAKIILLEGDICLLCAVFGYYEQNRTRIKKTDYITASDPCVSSSNYDKYYLIITGEQEKRCLGFF